MPVYTLEDVAKHNTKDDLWMVIHNKVYNLTEFTQEHPGGEEAIYDEAGRDATEPFEDIGHSDEAREMLEKYYIGDLNVQSSKSADECKPIRAGELPVEKKGSCTTLSVLLPALVVAGALLYKFVLNQKN
ncbi:hypothetical protein EC973_003896 [Apophysomyces ossiformis]|uniref:Cytochrome b5 heme-binding domain-containing protein n=1 Tax=Apophysomyces ossiformis TaxID=679940 RepID=A0A8H7ELS5_9FUNG|nr:hypothetical protein EC973_003896 [Apophysomyces ossiformis]